MDGRPGPRQPALLCAYHTRSLNSPLLGCLSESWHDDSAGQSVLPADRHDFGKCGVSNRRVLLPGAGHIIHGGKSSVLRSVHSCHARLWVQALTSGPVLAAGVIAHNAPAEGTRDSMFEIIQAMSNVGVGNLRNVSRWVVPGHPPARLGAPR
jgi:hypothetical protein